MPKEQCHNFFAIGTRRREETFEPSNAMVNLRQSKVCFQIGLSLIDVV